MKRIIAFACLSLFALITDADEIRPGYLELVEQTPGTYSIIFKIPQKRWQKPLLVSHFPVSCTNQTTITSRYTSGNLLQRWYIQCADNIDGKRISIDGMGESNTDVLLRWQRLNGVSSTALLKPGSPFYVIPAQSSTTDIATTYLGLGTEHILKGVDHLLFVFALLLIVNSTRRLVITITAFTLAHSITLGAATLGFVYVPQQPVEAVIALSILFLAVEIVHGQKGRPGYAARWPWMVAFIFGLLHGFGFAGALAEIGLPQQAIPVALVFFNIGVELGQLLFVFSVVLLTRILHRLIPNGLLKQAETAAIYAIGGLSSFWLIERISLF
jgi:hydrogenase/urease accessory protein HupE